MSQEEIDLQGAKILVVDDVPANIDVLRKSLEETGDYQVLTAPSGEEALEIVAHVVPELILLDVMMPGLDGYETCRRLKEDGRTVDVPVIFITARGEVEDVVRGFDCGGVDYIVKPFQKEEVLVRVRTHLERQYLTRVLVEKNAQLEEKSSQLEKSGRRLQRANRELQREIDERKALTNKLALVAEQEATRWGVDGFVGQSPTLQKILQNIKVLQQADSVSVLITGESGTGKELIARAVHANSARASKTFLPVNCATIPREMAESLLFGHKKGAFTGADADQQGYFDMADGGTLFLDEVGDMPYELQIKLLRVLEDGQVLQLGAQKSHPVDVRIVAATNADLDASIREGTFRQDLYYRIARFTVSVPPLRQRLEDVPLLARHFLHLFATEMGIETPLLQAAAAEGLAAHSYPGNVPERKNIVERGLIESRGRDVGPEHLYLQRDGAATVSASEGDGMRVEELPFDFDQAEMMLIERAIEEVHGNVAAAARLMGVDRSKIYRKLRQAGKMPKQRRV